MSVQLAGNKLRLAQSLDTETTPSLSYREVTGTRSKMLAMSVTTV